jgi:hypothetical protein
LLQVFLAHLENTLVALAARGDVPKQLKLSPGCAGWLVENLEMKRANGRYLTFHHQRTVGLGERDCHDKQPILLIRKNARARCFSPSLIARDPITKDKRISTINLYLNRMTSIQTSFYFIQLFEYEESEDLR